jgi:hypothetical protein
MSNVRRFPIKLPLSTDHEKHQTAVFVRLSANDQDGYIERCKRLVESLNRGGNPESPDGGEADSTIKADVYTVLDDRTILQGFNSHAAKGITPGDNIGSNELRAAAGDYNYNLTIVVDRPQEHDSDDYIFTSSYSVRL